MKDSAVVLEQLEKRLIEARSVWATVPIVLEENEDVRRTLGSGTLFTAQGKFFLITARHIFFEEDGKTPVDWARVAVPHGHIRSQFYTLGSTIFHVPDEKAEDLDVCVVELQSGDTVDALTTAYKFTSLEHIAGVQEGCSTYLCGFPRELMDKKGGVVIGKSLTVFSTLMPRPAAAKPSRFADLEFFAEYSHQGELLGSDDEGATPDLEGASGGGIWQVLPHDKTRVWSAESAVKLVGVQHAFLHSQFFRAMSWGAVAHCFEKGHSKVTKEIFAALGKR